MDRLLNSSEINVNLVSRQGRTAFTYAIGDSHPSVRELKIFYSLLGDDRTDIKPRDRHGRSCLSHLAENGATKALRALVMCEDGRNAVLQLLDDEGDNNGLSPLSHATIRGTKRDSVTLSRCETSSCGVKIANQPGSERYSRPQMLAKALSQVNPMA